MPKKPDLYRLDRIFWRILSSGDLVGSAILLIPPFVPSLVIAASQLELVPEHYPKFGCARRSQTDLAFVLLH